MWTVISAVQNDRWMACLDKAGRYDVYHLPGYHLAYEKETPARAHAYVAEIGGETLFHPIMLRPIDVVGDAPAPKGLYDAESVYGYAGPVASTDDPDFLAEAWRGYEDWCSERGVVCEFTRFNPMLGNHMLAARGATVWRDRATVAINLGQGEDGLWAGYTSPQRNRVRKALKGGLECVERPVAEGLNAFRRLYEQTMDNLGADAFYHFSGSYYETLIAALGDRVRPFVVAQGDDDLAAALFFLHGTTIHYHLGGSSSEHRHLAPNNLLFHEVARWAISRGLKEFHLGGGRGPEPDDSLLRFKSGFSPVRHDMYFGKQIFDSAAYDRLVSLWLDQAGSDVRPAYFQLYRLDPRQGGRAGRDAAA